MIALTLTYGAYMAEVYRAGIEAVPRGQMEAARSLGMSHGQAMRYVIVPQAIRKVIPPLLNDFIALMKDTSLVSVIGALEVVQVGFDIQTADFNGSGADAGRALLPRRHDPARALRRLADRATAAGARRDAAAVTTAARPGDPELAAGPPRGGRYEADETPRAPQPSAATSAWRASTSASASSRSCAAST